MVLEKTLESSLGGKESKPVNPKGNQHLIFIGRTNAEADAPILCPHYAKVDSLVRVDSLTLGRIEGKRRRGWQRMRWIDSITDSMNMNLSKLWYSEGQGSLACCSPWGRKESGMT